jgi:oxygen-independent coproporphyrinogen-3 oxidase
VSSRFGVEFDDYFRDVFPKLEEFVKDGLVSFLDDRMQVHENGRLVVRNIAMAFDRYLEDDQPDSKQKFSRTV